jgi:hypothetical protein
MRASQETHSLLVRYLREYPKDFRQFSQEHGRAGDWLHNVVKGKSDRKGWDLLADDQKLKFAAITLNGDPVNGNMMRLEEVEKKVAEWESRPEDAEQVLRQQQEERKKNASPMQPIEDRVARIIEMLPRVPEVDLDDVAQALQRQEGSYKNSTPRIKKIKDRIEVLETALSQAALLRAAASWAAESRTAESRTETFRAALPQAETSRAAASWAAKQAAYAHPLAPEVYRHLSPVMAPYRSTEVPPSSASLPPAASTVPMPDHMEMDLPYLYPYPQDQEVVDRQAEIAQFAAVHPGPPTIPDQFYTEPWQEYEAQPFGNFFSSAQGYGSWTGDASASSRGGGHHL